MKNIFLVTCAIGMFVLSANTVNGNNYASDVGLSKVITGNTESVVEHRAIVPYPYPNTNQKIPTTSPSIETMPFFDSEFTPHIRPYIRIAPNPEGRGLGTDFGIDFGDAEKAHNCPWRSDMWEAALNPLLHTRARAAPASGTDQLSPPPTHTFIRKNKYQNILPHPHFHPPQI